jgi:hypothetical protein
MSVQQQLQQLPLLTTPPSLTRGAKGPEVVIYRLDGSVAGTFPYADNTKLLEFIQGLRQPPTATLFSLDKVRSGAGVSQRVIATARIRMPSS